MKCILLILMSNILFISTCLAQSTRVNMQELEKKRKALLTQIQQSESMLNITRKDLDGQLQSLALLTTQITERQKYVTAIEKDVILLTREIGAMNNELRVLETELNDRKSKYEASLLQMQKRYSIEDKLLFVFSAKTLRQSYRRIRYLQEYSSFQKLQGEEVIRKQEQIKVKKEELEVVQNEKNKLLKDSEQERNLLQAQEKEKQTLLANLQKKQKDLQAEINKKRKEAARLDAQIDKLIKEEIARNNKRTAAEAKKETGKSTSASKAAPIDKFILNKADRQLSTNFEGNKGKLPVPINGPYQVIRRFGEYNVEGSRNVRLDNKGINFMGEPGAQARAIFDGEVSFVVKDYDLYTVLVRHGNYISVYSNLSSVSVKVGDKLKTKDSIGEVYSNGGSPVLHFQLRKETIKQNPEVWLDK